MESERSFATYENDRSQSICCAAKSSRQPFDQERDGIIAAPYPLKTCPPRSEALGEAFDRTCPGHRKSLVVGIAAAAKPVPGTRIKP